MTTERELLEAIQSLLDTEDNTGCTPDLTVVSKAAAEKLKKLREGWPRVSAACRFLPEDVMGMDKAKKLRMKRRRAMNWLADNRRHIEDAMCERGYAAIEDLLLMED